MRHFRDNPAAAYRRIDVDARIQGAQPNDLVGYCFDQAVMELNRSIRSYKRNDRSGMADGLTRALAAVTALEMGLDRNNPVSESLLHIYGGARETMLGSVSDFDSVQLVELSNDLQEIGQALTANA